MAFQFARGFRPDSAPRGYKEHHALLGESLPTLATPNLLSFRRGHIWQSTFGMCVGASLKRAVQLWLEAAGHLSQPMISGLGAYQVGRAEETADTDDPDNPTPLEDRGSEPGLVLLGSKSVGVFLETDLPDPTNPLFDPATVNQRPTPAQLVKAYDLKGLDFFEVTAAPGRRREAVRALAVRRQPWIFAMYVDHGIEDNRGEIVTKNDPAKGGGHMLCGLDASSDLYAVVDNWWDDPLHGIAWGMPLGNELGLPPGTWRLSWDVFEEQAIQIFGVRAAPPQLRVAA